MIHELKIHPKYLDDILDGSKRFEIRKDDRGFAVGHFLHLREWQAPWEQFGSRECLVRVTYKTDFEQKDGIVVLGITDPI